MSKTYKARKTCVICKKVFYAKYSGRIYCENCAQKKPKDNDSGVDYGNIC